jgi:hypothetical protein
MIYAFIDRLLSIHGQELMFMVQSMQLKMAKIALSMKIMILEYWSSNLLQDTMQVAISVLQQ